MLMLLFVFVKNKYVWSLEVGESHVFTTMLAYSDLNIQKLFFFYLHLWFSSLREMCEIPPFPSFTSSISPLQLPCLLFAQNSGKLNAHPWSATFPNREITYISFRHFMIDKTRAQGKQVMGRSSSEGKTLDLYRFTDSVEMEALQVCTSLCFLN